MQTAPKPDSIAEAPRPAASRQSVEGERRVTIFKPASVGTTEGQARAWDHRTALRQQGWR